MKIKTFIVIFILLSGCMNNSQTKELKTIDKINKSITLKYSSKLTVSLVEEKDKRLEISIEENGQDELLAGKMFYDYITEVKKNQYDPDFRTVYIINP